MDPQQKFDTPEEDAFYRRMVAIAETASTEAHKAEFLSQLPGVMNLYGRFIRNRKKTIDWSKIRPPPENMVIEYDQMAECQVEQKHLLADKLVVLKLNGGLSTTMGCVGPKSIIEVRQDQTFLDLIVQQIKDLNGRSKSSIPLVLMNSFNTDHETRKVIQKYSNVTVHTFNQSKFPRILKEGLMPAPDTLNGDDSEWYPPGHGDVFYSLVASGLLKRLLDEGKEYLFVSNVDNLGGTVDFNILKMMDEQQCEFVMEVTNKTRADIKGGTLIEYEGKAKLLEIAQVPGAYVEEFKSIKKFKIFNTNNFWVSLRAVERVVAEGVLHDMDVINNPKVVDGKAVIQLETAAGAAIQYFRNAKGVNVPRSRFLPVKSTSDLFIVQSNLYSLSHGSLVINPQRVFPSVPLVKLGDHFKKVGDYMSRFRGIPDVLELDQLTVSGDVTFGPGVVLKGTVIVVANHGARIDIPEGAILENKVVSGNLRILDH